jgi:prepilin-type N-terminal cleavage/methylation domain-containing protein
MNTISTIRVLWAQRQPRRCRGFSLVELLVTIALCVVIAALVSWALYKLYRVVKALLAGPMSSV